MSFSTAIFAYLGPETMLPMTSAVAGLVGVVMLFGRSSLRWARGAIRGLASMARSRPKRRAGTRKIGKGPVRRAASHDREQSQA